MAVYQGLAEVHIFHNKIAEFQWDCEEINLASTLGTLNHDSDLCTALLGLNEVGDHQEHLQPVLVQGTDFFSAKPDLVNEDIVSQSNLHFLPICI